MIVSFRSGHGRENEATLSEGEISIQKYILVLPTIGSTACAAIGVFANLKNKYQGVWQK
jgi:hypothetical protein